MSAGPIINCPNGFTRNMDLLMLGKEYERVVKSRNPENSSEWGWDYAGPVGKFVGKDTNYYQKMAAKGIRYGKEDGGVYTTEPAYKFQPSYSTNPIVYTESDNYCYRRTTADRTNVAQVFEQGTTRSNAELRTYLESDPSVGPIEPRAPVSGAPGHGPANLIASFAGLNGEKSMPAKVRLVQQLTAKVTAAERKEKEAVKRENSLKEALKQLTSKQSSQGQSLLRKNLGSRPPRPGFINATRSLAALDRNIKQKGQEHEAAVSASKEAMAAHAAALVKLKEAEEGLEESARIKPIPPTKEEALKNAENARSGGRYRKTRKNRKY
jgi:hypothetical protein